MGLFEEIQKKIEEAVAAGQAQQQAARRPIAPAQQSRPQTTQSTQSTQQNVNEQPTHVSLKDRHSYGAKFSNVNEVARDKSEAHREAMHHAVGTLEHTSDKARMQTQADTNNSHLHILQKLLASKSGVAALVLGQEILGPPLSKRPPRRR